MIVTRIVWVFPATYLPRRLSPSLRARDPYPPPRPSSSSRGPGMRGAVSLAAALALAADFPERDLIIFLTFCVILATLVGQGLTLPWLIRRLGVTSVAGSNAEEATARPAADEAALARLDELERSTRVTAARRPAAGALRATRLGHVRARRIDGPVTRSEHELLDHLGIRKPSSTPSARPSSGSATTASSATRSLRMIERDLDLEALRRGA